MSRDCLYLSGTTYCEFIWLFVLGARLGTLSSSAGEERTERLVSSLVLCYELSIEARKGWMKGPRDKGWLPLEQVDGTGRWNR